MERFVAAADACNTAATRRVGFVGVYGLLAIAMVAIADIVLRALANSPLPAMNEITQVFFAVAMVACSPAGLTRRIYVTVDLSAHRYGARLTAQPKCVGALTLFWFLALLEQARPNIDIHRVTTGGVPSFCAFRLPTSNPIMSPEAAPVNQRALWQASHPDRRLVAAPWAGV